MKSILRGEPEVLAILEELVEREVTPELAAELLRRIEALCSAPDAAHRWRRIANDVLSPAMPFAVHELLWERNYADRPAERGPPPYWLPDREAPCNLTRLLDDLQLADAPALADWAAGHRGEFWEAVIRRLGIVFDRTWDQVLDLTPGYEQPSWLVGARLNIAESCWRGDRGRIAVVEHGPEGLRRRWSLDELERRSARVARGLDALGLAPGDAVGVVLPITAEAIAVYLGVIRSGRVAVCIAESYAAEEVRRRMGLGRARLLFTCDRLTRSGKSIELYSRFAKSVETPIVVVGEASGALRTGDMRWSNFLAPDDTFDSRPAAPDCPTSILFSSGTTGDPKAIVWSHLTPIKCAADGFLYQDIQAGDIVAWPTSMGWMMGPWLIYASLVNGGTIATYDEHPATAGFCRFVEQAGVTVLGVVPSLVAAWKAGDLASGADWSRIKLFSSTGECSHARDMLYLASRAGYRPIIEYCGGTEIGGGYVGSTLLQPARLGCFTTEAFGLRLHVLDDENRPAQRGEVFIEPPSIGLSTELLGGDHHAAYYAGAPIIDGVPLRRHGDEIERLAGGGYRVHGRCDDTMNLGGIKVSSVEIERVLNRHPAVRETAAIGAPGSDGGPDRLAIYVVPAAPIEDQNGLRAELQDLLRNGLNPLFKIAELRIAGELPRTASNKVMRRRLREQGAPIGVDGKPRAS
jgi:acetyl-CoA synthetase